MQILVTGNPEPNGGRTQQGMTLIEVLLVVVIIAIMAAAIALSVNTADPDWVLKREASRLAALIDAQCDAAMLDATPRALQIEDQGYLFERFDGQQWWPIENNRAYRPHQFPGGVTASLQLEQRSVPGEDVIQRVICVASGEMSPFILSLEDQGQQRVLRGSLSGQLSIDDATDLDS